MTFQVIAKIGRNDPCPCGSGRKYKRCCLAQQSASYTFWAQQRNASDELTRDMLRFAERKFSDQIQVAWRDFNMTDLPVPFEKHPCERRPFHVVLSVSIGTLKDHTREKEQAGESALSLDV